MSPRITIFASELERMHREVCAWPDRETGGSLFGLWTASGAAVVFLATGPGAASQHRVTSFFPDIRLLEETADLLYTHAGLQHIGEWHSHHQLGLAEPSGGDLRSVWTGMAADRRDRFVLGIGNLTRSGTDGDLTCFGFHSFHGDTREALAARVRVIERPSPFRIAGLAPHAWSPARRPAGLQRLRPRDTSRRWTVRDEEDGNPWYAHAAVRARLQTELRQLAASGATPRLRADGDQVVIEAWLDERQAAWVLRPGFPRTPPQLKLDGEPQSVVWRPTTTLHDLVPGAQLPLVVPPRPTSSAETAATGVPHVS